MSNLNKMPSWADLIEQQTHHSYFNDALAFVAAERAAGKTVYPPQNQVFNAFNYTPFDQVKVVILGQDPYHGANQAHGLCFSVADESIKLPPSLKNIYKELTEDIKGFAMPEHGNLQSWANQGVLLLNTVLTVEQGKAHSHAKCGWEKFTDAMIAEINAHQSGVIFLLWGSHAHKKGAMIDEQKHQVLKTVHPSPLSAYRGFFGCKHFSQCNDLLKQQNKKEIDWRL